MALPQELGEATRALVQEALAQAGKLREAAVALLQDLGEATRALAQEALAPLAQ